MCGPFLICRFCSLCIVNSSRVSAINSYGLYFRHLLANNFRCDSEHKLHWKIRVESVESFSIIQKRESAPGINGDIHANKLIWNWVFATKFWLLRISFVSITTTTGSIQREINIRISSTTRNSTMHFTFSTSMNDFVQCRKETPSNLIIWKY